MAITRETLFKPDMATHEQLESTSSRPAMDPTTSITKTIRIGSRNSKLALIQSEIILKALQSTHPMFKYEVHGMKTMGDKNQVTPLHNFGAKSLWTSELEAGLLEGQLDIVVHCLKDMPTQLPAECALGAILERADPRDAMIMKPGLPYKTIAELPAGSIVGTSSVRRSAQISRNYPHLKFKDVRGNIQTRLSKLDAEDGEYACLILAAAGLLRLDMGDRITQYLDSKTPGGGMMYAVGQAALAIEIRAEDKTMLALLKELVDDQVTLACLAERSLMRALEGGCSVPIGVETEWIEKGKLLMKALVISLDGTECVETERLAEIISKKDADEFGFTVAQDLVDKGAGKILEAINLNRDVIAKGDGA